MIMFLYCLTGELDLIVTENGSTSRHRLFAHTCNANYIYKGRYSLGYPVGKRAQILRILFPYKFFLNILGENGVTAELQNLVKDRKILNQIRPITPVINFNIKQILDPSSHGAAPNFFFMARIMELINCMLNGKTEKNGQPVTHLGREQTGKARAILENNLEHPPSLDELAGRVGVSSAKLKQIFPRVCGMPPYAYLRKLRMEKAMCLLNNGEMSVTEAAYEVGYSSLSHFSRVFAKCFGMKPSEIRRLNRSR
ncbi:MAG: AraC family transcriptional regulator [Thermodesulfobacteriota bacterium]|nr:AraC family transcriptional regulator [Thermodesulfobacteriota bacterium]